MLVKDLICSFDFENSENCPSKISVNCLSEILVNDEELEFDINEDGELWVHSDSLKLLDKEVDFWSTEIIFETNTENGCLNVFPYLKLVIRAV